MSVSYSSNVVVVTSCDRSAVQRLAVEGGGAVRDERGDKLYRLSGTAPGSARR